MWNVKQLSGFRVSNDNNVVQSSAPYRDNSDAQQYQSGQRLTQQ